MKNLFWLVAFTLLFTTASFAETKKIVTGQSIIGYSPVGERYSSNMLLSKVIPAEGENYYVDFTVEISPAGPRSTVGFSTYNICYYLRKGDKIFFRTNGLGEFLPGIDEIPIELEIVELGNNYIVYDDGR